MLTTYQRSEWVRRPLFSALALALALGLSGCAVFFPSRPNNAPLYFTPQNGNILFRWCGELTEEYDSIDIEYRLAEDGEKLDLTAAQGNGTFRLDEGVEFTSEYPPDGVIYERTGAVPINDAPIGIYVHARSQADGRLVHLGDFNRFGMPPLEDGAWYTTTGLVDEAPC
jgi:hypothetical protein